MWLRQIRERIRTSRGPVILIGGLEFGISQIISSFGEDSAPLAWMEFRTRDRGDPIIQGNKLAEALTRSLGSPLFGYAMPYSYGLAVLKSHLTLLGPLVFAVSGAEHTPELAQSLLQLNRQGSRVVLHFATTPELKFPKNSLIFHSKNLLMTLEQAHSEAKSSLPTIDQAIVEGLWQQSGGLFEPFRTLLAQAQGLPMVFRPSPIGPQLLGEGLEVNLKAVFDTLVRQKRFVEALELAVSHLQYRIEEVLEPAAEAMWTRGTHAFMARQLAGLPPQLRKSPNVLRWELAAAISLGKEEALLADVKQALSNPETPAELRAWFGQALKRQGDLEGYLHQTQQAVSLQKTPLTLYSYAKAIQASSPEQSLQYFKEALRLAEAQNGPYWATQATHGLTQSLIQAGHYSEAQDWAEWGLNLYQRENLGHSFLRLALLNELAIARILVGDTVGLAELLKEEFGHLDQVEPSWATLFKTTLAGLMLVGGRAAEASRLYAEIWQQTKDREHYAALANLWVRSLLEEHQFERALQVAKRAVRLTNDLSPPFRQQAELALAMVQSFSLADKTIQTLEELQEAFSKPLLAVAKAQAALYLARCYLSVGDLPKAHKTIDAARPVLSGLGSSGLHYLAGPASFFGEVFDLIQEHPNAPLRAKFLGDTTLIYNGLQISLRQRFADIVMALMLNPHGLSGEKLTVLVYGETGNLATTKADLSRLREIIPIQARPYRLGVEFSADFIEAQRLLAGGKVGPALNLYRGSLLPDSDAPLVIEEREVLEEILRQAVLSSGNHDSILLLAELLKDDLEVWEAAITALPKNDPRRVLAKARMERVATDW